MKIYKSYRTAALGIFIAALLPLDAAHAQLGDLLKKGGSTDGITSSLGNLGNLGGIGGVLSGQSLSSTSTGNVAGVLEYCIKNNYLRGNSASSVKDSILSKLPGGSSTSDSDYASGANGILNSGEGEPLDLSSGGGLKAEITRQVCDNILSIGKSLL